CHDTRATDYSELGHPAELGQDAVLDSIGKKSALLSLAQIFKGHYRDCNICWAAKYTAFPSHHPHDCSEGPQEHSHSRSSRIASRPAGHVHGDRNRSRDNG